MKKPKYNRYSGDVLNIGTPGYNGPHQEIHTELVRYKWNEGAVVAALKLTPELVREAERLGLNVKPVKP